LLDADERFVPFTLDYLLTPNHKIAKKDVQHAGIVVNQYEQFLKKCQWDEELQRSLVTVSGIVQKDSYLGAGRGQCSVFLCHTVMI
jgi:hypothetical protein